MKDTAVQITYILKRGFIFRPSVTNTDMVLLIYRQGNNEREINTNPLYDMTSFDQRPAELWFHLVVMDAPWLCG